MLKAVSFWKNGPWNFWKTLTTMLKACPSSQEQRALVSRAEQAGLEPDTFTFNLLLGKLYVEGRTEEAEALHRDMVQRGVQPDEYTAKLLGEEPEEVLCKQHTVQLGHLLKAGETAKAWELFDGLLERGHAELGASVRCKRCQPRCRGGCCCCADCVG